jgi:hypothetical protein
MRWSLLIIGACIIGAAAALAFSLLRPQTHNIASIFGDVLFGLVIVIAVLMGGRFWLVR